MAIFFDNYDLGFFQEDERYMRGLWSECIQNGKPVNGYSGVYINHHMGDAEMIIRLVKSDESWDAIGIDTHSAGRCVWNVRMINTLQCTDPLEKRCLVKNAKDGCGMTVINIVNADVLPSFAEDEEIQLQMIAFSTAFHYYASEEEYVSSLPKNNDGETWGIAEGSIFPAGFLRNHSADNEAAETDDETDLYVLVHAKVKQLYWGTVQLGDTKRNCFIRCLMETQFGELEFVHTYDQVPEEERQNIRVGSTVSGVFVLSGDAAIYEYENGLVRNRENHLKLIRHSITKGDPERMRAVLAKDAVYQSETLRRDFHGPNEIINHFSKVASEGDSHYYVQTATIVELKEADGLLYPAGTRCAVLSQNAPENYESLAFIDMDDDGNIKRLLITADSRYVFRIDPRPKERELDFEMPDSVLEPVVNRARLHGLIDTNDTDCNELIESIKESNPFQATAKELAQYLRALPEGEFNDALQNTLGDLFETILKKEFTGFAPEAEPKIKNAREIGCQFFRDFHFLHQEYLPSDEQWTTDLVLVLTAVQMIAMRYVDRFARRDTPEEND